MSAARKRERDDNDGGGGGGGGGDDDDNEITRQFSYQAAPQSADHVEPGDSPSGAAGPGPGGTSSNFRNVSACNRCRHRKNRCDQRLPRCSACVKVNAQCVGFDPVSKREIPRSYVYFLETRLRSLEALLDANGIPVPPPEEDFPISEAIKPGVNVPFPPLEDDGKPSKPSGPLRDADAASATPAAIDPALEDYDDRERRHGPSGGGKGVVRVHAPKDPRRPAIPSAPTPGISFSKVVFAAVRSSVSQNPSERGGVKSEKVPSPDSSASHSTLDSFFGLYTRPTYKPALFPEKELGRRLVDLYFEHANPQIPILHRGEFTALFDRVYAKPASERTARELYLLKIVFAVGSGIIMDSASSDHQAVVPLGRRSDLPNKKRQRVATHQHQPEEYHASAVAHLESFLSTPAASEGHGGGLEELQAVLLLAALALLRPVAPGLWYIVGVAVRLSVDLGLHFEDVDPALDDLDIKSEATGTASLPGAKLGRKQWTRDLRRRLWWSVYSFDRLVSTCVGRPFGISDQVVTTEFPSMLDDTHITTQGFLGVSASAPGPTYKLVSHHYFRLRLLQSEILQVLQYRQAQQARALGANAGNVFMHARLPSPFLQRFDSFRDWRADVDRRLGEWKDGAPARADIGVSFTPLFLELNYWQAIVMLYRQSLSVPAPLAEELSASTGEEVHSPGTVNQELKQDEQQVFLKVAQAGQMVLKTYRQLHRLKLVNYTFLATHHLFMSGISFLYAIWHSPSVRSQLTLDDVDFTILAATSVLTDLIDKCPPAEACRDAFTRMSKATITMCMTTTGFGSASSLGSHPLDSPGGGNGGGYFSPRSSTISQLTGSAGGGAQVSKVRKSPFPALDAELRDLFSDEEISSIPRPGAAALTLQNTGGAYNMTQSTASPPPPQPQQQASHQLSNTQPYAPLADSIAQVQPDLTFDNLDFLDTFPVADPNQQFWGLGSELDLGFGTGGTAGAYDGGGSNGWDAGGDGFGNPGGGGVDLFDGFFFGGGNAGGF